MPSFVVKYKKNGKIYEQKFSAQSKKALEETLQKKKVLVLAIDYKESWLDYFFLQKPKTKEISSAFYQLKFGLKANLPLKEILENIQKYTKNNYLKMQFLKVSNSLHQGRELAACFREAGFSDFICAMIGIGQKSGRLVESVEFILLDLQNRQKNHKLLRKILFYPLFVVCVMVLVFLGITLFVLPQFESLFASLDSSLPLASQSLLFMRVLVLNYGVLILGVMILGLWLLRKLYCINNKFQAKISKWLLKIPFLGRVLYFYQTSQFLLCFYWLYKSNLELKIVLEIATKSLSNTYLKERLQEIYPSLMRGALIADSFEGSGVWDLLSVQLLHSAKDQAGFLEALEVILALHQEELQNKSESLLAMMEPLMVFVLGILVLWLALGIFLPLWELPMQIKG
ncbi:type II secretion system F family protein [Helicobacter colisuis]|uniref:Type II secretion system F family protein n=1 Tax=Helicobacter colisuis TaxID=2949739 RepID=A0ABT0TWB1_9HELI|nr:type II secretion system F family protein [Helicobacter colisuis]MCL9819975.1 type II secretion system F family protein [Helicobacter colisuis]